MYRHFFKRFFDIALSFLGLPGKLDSPGPVLFWQERVGIHKKNFRMPEFRSMYTRIPANMPTHLLSDL